MNRSQASTPLRQRIPCTFLLLVGSLAFAAGCAESLAVPVTGAAQNPALPPGSAYRDISGQIESTPFAPRHKVGDGPLFERLDAKRIGIDFFHKWNSLLGVNRNTATGSGVAMGDYDGDGRV